MPHPALPPALKALNAGLSLPPDLIRRLSREAFVRNQSKSALAQEILRRHFQRLSSRRENTPPTKNQALSTEH